MLQVHVVQSEVMMHSLSYERDNHAEFLKNQEELAKKTIKGQRYQRVQRPPNFTSKKQ